MRCLSLCMASQCNPSSNNDDQNDDQLDNAQEVLQTDTPFQSNRVDEEGGSETSQPDATLIPSSNFDLSCVEDILAEYDTVTGGPSEQNSIGCEHGGGQELGLLVDIFEVILLASVSVRSQVNQLYIPPVSSRALDIPWNRSSPFQVHSRSG